MEEYIQEAQKESFYDYFVREIEPNVVKYEFQRNKLRQSFIKLICIIAVIIIASIFLINKYQIFFWDYGINPFDIIMIIIIISAIILFISYWICFGSILECIEKATLSKLLKYLDIKKLSDPIQKKDYVDSYLSSLELNPKYDSISLENYLKKHYKGIDINISEIELTRGYGRGRRTIFKGIFMFFSNPKEQKAELIIKQNKSLLGKAFEFSSLPLCKIDNDEFEQVYDVYTYNSEVAKRILNYKFIAKLLSLKKNNNYKSLTLSFEKNAVNILIGTNKSLFKFSPFKKTYDYKQYEDIIRNLQKILKIIDILNLCDP